MIERMISCSNKNCKRKFSKTLSPFMLMVRYVGENSGRPWFLTKRFCCKPCLQEFLEYAELGEYDYKHEHHVGDYSDMQAYLDIYRKKVKSK